VRLDHLLKRNIRKIQLLYFILKFISSVIPILGISGLLVGLGYEPTFSVFFEKIMGY
jgi:hypothetical protein